MHNAQGTALEENPLSNLIAFPHSNVRLGTPLVNPSGSLNGNPGAIGIMNLPPSDPMNMHEEIPAPDISVSSDLLVSNAELNFSSFIHGDGAREKFK